VIVLAGLAVPIVALLAVTAYDLVASPPLRRLALRRISRRPVEGLFVVLGSLLGTAIICASFVVGDTLNASIRDLARTQYGPIDQAVAVSGLTLQPDLEQAFTEPVRGSDGTLSVVSAPAAVARTTGGGERRASPRAQVHELDVAEARRFGNDVEATGFADVRETPAEGTALLGEDLAEDLDARRGDIVEVFLYGVSADLEVAGFVPRLGVAGFFPDVGSRSPVLFVAPGTIAQAAAAVREDPPTPPTVRMMVSNEGGVFSGMKNDEEVRRALEERAAAVPGAEVQAVKEGILEQARTEGAAFTQLFTGIGGFAVIAGLLLLVNIFVMLAEERKAELGLLRAVGMRRHHLVRAFGIEGGIYAVVATLVGAGAGVLVGRVIVAVTAGLLAEGDVDLDVQFAVNARSLLTATLIGAAISLVTVWLTSARIGQLVVVDAVHDLPERPPARRGRRLLPLAALGVAGGGALFGVGLIEHVAVAVLLGPAVTAFCLIPLLQRLIPTRIAVTVPSLGALVWGLTAFVAVPEVLDDAGVPLFVVQGVILVASAVAVTSVNGELYQHAARVLVGWTRRGLATRLGFAYPLARPFRTGLLVGMYALVMFTLTFIAVFAHIFSQQVPALTDATRAGYDLLVDSNPANPVDPQELAQVRGVESSATLVRGLVDVEADAIGNQPRPWAITGIDEKLLDRGTPELGSRSSRYGSDEEAWRAVLADPSLAVVSEFFLQEQGGAPRTLLEVGDRFSVADRSTLARQDLTVVGVMTSDFQLNGLLVGRSVVDGLLGARAVPNRTYVAVTPGADPAQVARALDGELVSEGVDARTFRSVVEDSLAQQQGFFHLMQGFLSLGLLVGIAGLAVVMVRAVRERRRQIGMLRAMGFTGPDVRMAFLVEATFVAVRGLVLGVLLGLVTSYSLLDHSSVFEGAHLDFSVPWRTLALVVGIPLVSSLLAAVGPASRASDIRPAVALRVAG
jgi:putative ABC transport system permease protein